MSALLWYFAGMFTLPVMWGLVWLFWMWVWSDDDGGRGWDE